MYLSENIAPGAPMVPTPMDILLLVGLDYSMALEHCDSNKNSSTLYAVALIYESLV